MRKIQIFFCSFLLIHHMAQSQSTFPVNGVHHVFEPPIAYTHATLVKGNGDRIENATLLVEKGKIKAVGTNLSVPAGYVELDYTGYWIYPSFIDLYSSYGIPEVKREPGGRNSEDMSQKPGAHYWNEAIHPEVNALDYFHVDPKKSESMLKAGFGVVLTHRPDGIARGTGALVTLAPENENLVIIDPASSAHFSFNKGQSNQSYPSSLMGHIALLRQAFYDAQWYAKPINKETNISLQSLNKQKSLPGIFDAGGIANILRADLTGDEFGIQFIMKGGGDEYQYINELKASGASVILPLTFPAAYELKSSADVLNTRLIDMQHWEMAPANAFLLKSEGIPLTFTFNGIKNETEFKKALEKIMSYGLSESDIIKMLTVVPASWIKKEKETGNLEVGMYANFFITDGNYFSENTSNFGHCLMGKMYTLYDRKLPDARGTYVMANEKGDTLKFEIQGKRSEPSVKWISPEMSGKKSIEAHALPYRVITPNAIYEIIKKDSLATAREIGLNETKNFTGKVAPLVIVTKEKDKKTIPAGYTFKLPYQYNKIDSTTLIKGAKIWTCEKEMGLIDGDVLIENGKIKDIKKDIPAKPGWKIVEANGRYLTPGLIDEHSHIAIQSGVNEGTQSVTSEVRIADVIQPQDINIYRQLAGGVTTSHLLHGSANAIGGQTALIKLRYGASAEELKKGYNHKFIKFALGENVKQSNWGERAVSRYPQTRMGVEQIIADAFIRAKEYKKTAGTPDFRQDLELDALCEILEGKRHITCHSYQQGEINMLIHLADSLGFKVNTFTHILEGYKVADKMKAHGAAASTFADWWGYKYEVIEAIPYNAALLNQMGIVTGINSDDAEMGRRLNQEAAKSIKYGNMSELDAMNMVTINPAKMLHIDKQTGSIAIGKDADLVMWNANPLSVYSKAVTTWVDGRIYYDEQMDLAWQKEIENEKLRLWQAMHTAVKKGETAQKPKIYKEELYHCDDE